MPAIGARDFQDHPTQLAPIIHDGYRIWAGRAVVAGLTAVCALPGSSLDRVDPDYVLFATVEREIGNWQNPDP